MSGSRKATYLSYLASAEWTKIRVDIVAVRGDRCEICGKHGSQVHHRTYGNLGCEEPGDLILLCGTCHQKSHGLIKVRKRKPKKIKREKVAHVDSPLTPKRKPMSIEALREKSRAMDLKQA